MPRRKVNITLTPADLDALDRLGARVGAANRSQAVGAALRLCPPGTAPPEVDRPSRGPLAEGVAACSTISVHLDAVAADRLGRLRLGWGLRPTDAVRAAVRVALEQSRGMAPPPPAEAPPPKVQLWARVDPATLRDLDRVRSALHPVPSRAEVVVRALDEFLRRHAPAQA